MPRNPGIPSETELELMSLVVRKRTGGEVRELYKRQTDQDLSPGTMFTTFRRLKERDWVEVESGQDEDGRVRSFKLTKGGIGALSRGRHHYASVAEFGMGLEGAVAGGGIG